MKKGLLLSVLLACTVGLVGCNSTSSSSEGSSVDSTSSSISSSETSSSESSSSSSSEEEPSDTPSTGDQKYEDKYYELPENVEEFSLKLSVSGALIDYNIHKKIVTGAEDVFEFDYTDLISATSTCTSSNEEVLKIEKVTENKYKVFALHEGNAVLNIKDGRGLDRYNIIVYVRDPMTRSEIEDYLSEVEYWESVTGFGDSYKLTFLFDNQVGISGSLQNVPFESYTATYSFKEETFDEYRYNFTDDKTKQHEASLTSFHISKAGDLMYLIYTNGVAAIMLPVFEK